MQEYYSYCGRNNTRVRQPFEDMCGFTIILLMLFILTGFGRMMTSDLGGARREEVAAIMPRAEALKQKHFRLLDSLKTDLLAKGDAWTQDDAWHARYILFPTFDSLSRVGMMENLECVSPFFDMAQANAEKLRQQGIMVQLDNLGVISQWGHHPIEAEGRIKTGSILKVVGGFFSHFLWLAMFMPGILLIRLMWRTRCSLRAFVKATGPYLWWLGTCSLFWPFLASSHAEKEPRETTRFFKLRFFYMVRHRKMFITLAEKEALLRAAGTAEEHLDKVFDCVEQAALAATGTGRRLAIVSYLLGFITFAGFHLQPSVAAAQEQAQEAEKPELKLGGFFVTSLEADKERQTMQLQYLRFRPKYVDGRWSFFGELAPNKVLQVKFAYVGYDFPELQRVHFNVEAGRVIAPWVYMLPPPFKSSFSRTPFDGQLDIPFTDNGVVGVASYRGFELRTGMLNGSGEYSDNNSSMDATVRASYASRLLSVGASLQRGIEPDGIRELRAFDLTLNADPCTFSLMGLERPRLEGNGFATSVVVRAGPKFSFVGQYEKSRVNGKRFQSFDGGVNFRENANRMIRLHGFAASGQKPRAVLEFVQSF